MLSLPEDAADLSPGWLSAALGGEVVDVVARPLGTGQMCDSLRLHLTWADPAAGPATVVAKLPAADPTSRSTALALRSYEKEVRFYQELAASLPVRTPALHHADLDPATAAFVLLLEDLAPAEPGDQLRGCTPDVAAAALEQLVLLHAPRWGDPGLADLDWLHGDPDASREFLTALLPALWAGFRERYAADVAPHVLPAGDLLFGRLDDWFAPQPVRTVTHGDFRLDNLLFAPDGAVTVLDWQTCADGVGPSDVAYFLGAGLQEDERRGAEQQLVADYHAGLVAAGVEGYDADRCWRDYRRGAWSGLVMAVGASMMVERTARGDAMFLAMAARHARHALDLDADDVLAG